jgi:hypothetical protein
MIPTDAAYWNKEKHLVIQYSCDCIEVCYGERTNCNEHDALYVRVFKVQEKMITHYSMDSKVSSTLYVHRLVIDIGTYTVGQTRPLIA